MDRVRVAVDVEGGRQECVEVLVEGRRSARRDSGGAATFGVFDLLLFSFSF